MDTQKLLEKVGIKSDEPVLLITAKEAITNLIEAIEEYCPNLDITKMKKEDLITLLSSYGMCVIKYHPERRHQERGTLLENFKMLKRYGLTEDEYGSLDFC